MPLVDSTVVIVYLRTLDAKLLALFRSHPVKITGLVRAELLAGARDAAEAVATTAAADSFAQLDFPHSLWDSVGHNRARLRPKGLTLPFNDVVLATLAMHYDLEVWSRDRHFVMLQSVFPTLRLFQEPTP